MSVLRSRLEGLPVWRVWERMLEIEFVGEVRARVLVPTGVITAVAMAAFAVSATVWMPGVVTPNEAQFGFFVLPWHW